MYTFSLYYQYIYTHTFPLVMKLIVFHPSSLHKHSSSGGATRSLLHRCSFLLFLLSFFSLLSLFLTFSSSSSPSLPITSTAAATSSPSPLLSTLLHYASNSSRFSSSALKSISTVLLHRSSSNFLVFGLTHETLLWKTLNHQGRTVFIDESSYLVSKMEEKYPKIEAYDVELSLSSRSMGFQQMMRYAKKRSKGQCRPVQDLLYTECKLGINNLPNFVYDVAWDVVLVDGPKEVVGKVAAIYSAGVLARRRGRGEGGGTHVFVYGFGKEVEIRVCSEEFLCRENLVEEKGGFGHFVLEGVSEGQLGFCTNRTLSLWSDH